MNKAVCANVCQIFHINFVKRVKTSHKVIRHHVFSYSLTYVTATCVLIAIIIIRDLNHNSLNNHLLNQIHLQLQWELLLPTILSKAVTLSMPLQLSLQLKILDSDRTLLPKIQGLAKTANSKLMLTLAMGWARQIGMLDFLTNFQGEVSLLQELSIMTTNQSRIVI